jgi:hypothetical protein
MVVCKIFISANAFCEFYVDEKSFVTHCVLGRILVPGYSFDLSFGFIALAASLAKRKINCGDYELSCEPASQAGFFLFHVILYA